MSAGFSTAADWLQNISGPNANNQVDKKDDAHDPVLQDLRAMQDAETKDGGRSLPPPRVDGRNLRNAAHTGGAHLQQQPKPKFVAHKDPTRGKKGKSAAKSNRLGNELHMA
eukprot:912535_1